MGKIARSNKGPHVLVVEEMAHIYNLRAFFVFNWMEANRVKFRKVRGKPVHVVNAVTFCKSVRGIIRAAGKVRDDRNTRAEPNRIPTIENMLYLDPDKKRIGPYDSDDIDRPVYASRDTEVNRNGVEVSKLYRVNEYRDGSKTLDVLDRTRIKWKTIESPERWECKDILLKWAVKYRFIQVEK